MREQASRHRPHPSRDVFSRNGMVELADADLNAVSGAGKQIANIKYEDITIAYGTDTVVKK